MLKNLHIENYALITHSDINFENGFIAITGETGAGKSILLGALGLLLGDRADNQALYNKENKCIIEASLDVNQLGLEPFFLEHDLDYDDTLLLRRELLPNGKSRAFVNDSPVALTLLRELGSRLVDIHSQHQTLTLTGSQFQLDLLDNLAAHGTNESSVLQDYHKVFAKYQQLKHQLEVLTEQDAQNRKELDYNRFLFDELDNAKLNSEEQEQLEEEQQLLSSTEEIKESFAQIFALTEGDDENAAALSALTSVKGQLAHISHCHKDIEELHQRMDSVIIELRDIMDEVHRLDDRFQYSPERQTEVDDRLDLIYRLEKKHNVENVSELLKIHDDLDRKLQNISNTDEQIHHTMEAVDAAYHQVQQLAATLTKQRKQSAKKLEEALLPTLAELGMKEARLQVHFATATDYNINGGDMVQFLFNANKGGELRELSKVASGGELSRLMLAVKSMISQQKLLPTIIFDEIDSGVSGDIAGRVGTIMQRMARNMQVIAITHLPQIAARAGQHLKVYKAVEDETQRTVSHIKTLSQPERLHEIAMMLSTDPPTEAALQTARELMEF